MWSLGVDVQMKGSYCLVIDVNEKVPVQVGALGKIVFEKGTYAYVGSAMNSLEKRIARHLRSNKKKFWHIDYLLSNKNVGITKVFYKKSERKEECEIANKVAKHGREINNFGCSDCKCKAHLFKLENSSLPSDFKMEVWK